MIATARQMMMVEQQDPAAVHTGRCSLLTPILHPHRRRLKPNATAKPTVGVRKRLGLGVLGNRSTTRACGLICGRGKLLEQSGRWIPMESIGHLPESAFPSTSVRSFVSSE